MTALLLLALALPGVLPGSPAGLPDGRGFRPRAEVATLGGLQSELDEAAMAFARAWRDEGGEALAARMSPDGIRLRLEGEDHPLLPARQARAALEDYLGSRSTRALDLSRVVDLGGAPRRGFAEIRWEAVVDGTSEPVPHTLFVGYARDDRGWWITEIRVF